MTATATPRLENYDPLVETFPGAAFVLQSTVDQIPTYWVERSILQGLLAHLRPHYEMLFDLTAMDERQRVHREDLPTSDFTVIYHLFCLHRRRDLRIKVALLETDLALPSIHELYPNANWYEREVWDMFGVVFTGHPNLYRILLPPTWEGHALRKDHPARATEMEPFKLDEARQDREQEALRFRPEQWGMQRKHGKTEFMFLNLGPNHPSVHGVFRIV
ncbi:MAG: NADH-quinone oxidoreductase subunit C/D, partial [Cyclobacteriaceae bacterium]